MAMPLIDPDDPRWVEKLELDLTQAQTGTRPAVRNDCAFCGWERSAKDDNHGPTCSHWHFFGDQDEPCPCWKCNDLPNPRPVR